MQLTESHVFIRVRQVDLPIVESLIDSIQQEYKQATKKDALLKIDQETFLPAESCGGVELLTSKGNNIIN